jgi:hypothetical protein
MTALRSEEDRQPRTVPLRDYLALRDRCEDLEAEVRDLRREARLNAETAPVAILAKKLDIHPGAARLLIALAKAYPGYIRRVPPSIEGGNRVMWVRMHTLRHALMDLGSPPEPVRTLRSVGYQLTDEAVQWLRGAIPSLFDEGDKP